VEAPKEREWVVVHLQVHHQPLDLLLQVVQKNRHLKQRYPQEQKQVLRRLVLRHLLVNK
jgi:hypothetical protein